ncbi:MAG: PLDc N-terminal domain-containing protein [Bifidobacteriaceae bacterium]|jgi:hypothetical protein|nr:PLDc N-terminal domain-containing protein [Bifidobacteriaceae bacterium]
MFRILLYYVIPLALMIYAIVDCAADDDVERTSVPKILWILIILFLPIAGPIAWLAVAKIGKPRRYPPAPGAGPDWSGGYQRRPAPLAPDDNPEYLRRLADEQARKDRERRRKERKDRDQRDESGEDDSGAAA